MSATSTRSLVARIQAKLLEMKAVDFWPPYLGPPETLAGPTVEASARRPPDEVFEGAFSFSIGPGVRKLALHKLKRRRLRHGRSS